MAASRHGESSGYSMSAVGTEEVCPGFLRVSPNGRYFIDQNGKSFFWLGDTQWELFRAFQLADVRAILGDRRRKGFSVVQVMLTGVGDGNAGGSPVTRPGGDGKRSDIASVGRLSPE